ncbi:hypothetical protein Tco_0323716 [Tanacetum coccineum]
MSQATDVVSITSGSRDSVKLKTNLHFGALRMEELILVQEFHSDNLMHFSSSEVDGIDSDYVLAELEPKLYEGNVIKNTSAIVIPDSEETLMLAEESHPSPSCRPTKVEVPKELPKVSMVNKSLKKLKHHLVGFDVVFAITALKEELRKLKGKGVIACRESVNKPKVFALVVHKVDLESLSPKLKNNREAHEDYIRITKENTDTLCDIVEQDRTSNPLDNALAYACMYMKQIQELLIYVSDTCPSSQLKSKKLVVVKPMNKARKVTFAKTQIQVDVHQTQTTNKPLVPSTNEKCSTNVSRSKPQSETKNNRIMQPLSMNDRARAKAVKSIKMKEWKPTGKMFKNVGYKWVPTGRTFIIVGTKCPLTRFTSTKTMPPRIPIKSTVKTNKKPSSASQWRSKETNHASSSSAPKIVESRTANHLEPNNHMGSNVSISPCSSSVQCSQNWRDLPRDISLDRIEVLRFDTKGVKVRKGKMRTKTELTLEQTQQGTSYEVLVSAKGVEELKRKVTIKDEKNEALLTLRQKPGQYICCLESQR